MRNTCCSDSHKHNRTALCPANGKAYPRVAQKTILHQLASPWEREIFRQNYYFCSDPECSVAYFTEQCAVETEPAYECHQDIIKVAELRHQPGQKSTATDRKICYCFDICLSDITSERARQSLKQFVIDKTATGLRACETRNPSGRCCLADYPSQ